MVNRIRELLLARQLSPTQFADAIGLARPIVSHIMSGRNKPSLEVVQKIRAAFPDLSMLWLLDGSGPMLAPAEAPLAVENTPATAHAPPRRPANAPLPQAPATPSESDKIDFESDTPALTTAKVGPAPASPLPVVPQPGPLPAAGAYVPAAAQAPVLPAAPPGAPGLPPEAALFAEPGKAIRRIVIFYRDGTFADYQPE